MPRPAQPVSPTLVRLDAEPSAFGLRTVQVMLPLDVISRLQAVDPDLSVAVLKLIKGRTRTASTTAHRWR